MQKKKKKIRELWITSWKNIDGGNEAKNAFAAMNTFFEDMKDMFGAGGFPGGSNPYNEMVLVDGFPVVVNNFNEVDGSLEDESILKSTKRRTLDPADFEPPSGYKRRSMMPN